MHNSRTHKHALTGRILLGVMFVCSLSAGVHAAQEASNGASGVGEFRIEGESIERLVLADANGNNKEFGRPGAVVTLPEGEYDLQEVALEGGYQCWSRQVPEGSLVAVSRDRPGVLKVGAPLSQRIRPQRRGAVLMLHFEIVG